MDDEQEHGPWSSEESRYSVPMRQRAAMAATQFVGLEQLLAAVSGWAGLILYPCISVSTSVEWQDVGHGLQAMPAIRHTWELPGARRPTRRFSGCLSIHLKKDLACKGPFLNPMWGAHLGPSALQSPPLRAELWAHCRTCWMRSGKSHSAT